MREVFSDDDETRERYDRLHKNPQSYEYREDRMKFIKVALMSIRTPIEDPSYQVFVAEVKSQFPRIFNIISNASWYFCDGMCQTFAFFSHAEHDRMCMMQETMKGVMSVIIKACMARMIETFDGDYEALTPKVTHINVPDNASHEDIEKIVMQTLKKIRQDESDNGRPVSDDFDFFPRDWDLGDDNGK